MIDQSVRTKGVGMSVDYLKKRCRFHRIFLGLFLLFWVVGSGCYTKTIQEAFDGSYSAKQNNRIISEYCQSCHLHKDFDPDTHVENQVLAYKRRVFRFAEECRICHFIEKKFALNEFARKTRRPREANSGKFRKFEKEIWKSQKEKRAEKNRS